MQSGFVIRKNQYYDSVFLMGISKRLSDIPGVQQNAVLMGSESNKGLLASIGIQGAEIDAAQPSDLIVAVIAETSQKVNDVLIRLDEYLLGGADASATSNPHSLEEGLAKKRNANLAVISIPGEYAAAEARKALEAGLHVFLFSDNVSIEDELALKHLAEEKNLLVMGPGCGTGMIGGVGLGFADVIRRGSIGVIAGAGSGLQEFTCQVHNAGFGISHAIGTGGRDLSDAIGGLTTFVALDALEADPQTEIIVLLSKPAGDKTLSRLMERFKTCRKPIIGCFLGARLGSQTDNHIFQYANTVDEAVRLAINSAGGKQFGDETGFSQEELGWMAHDKSSWSSEQRFVRGVLAGGTFCYQSQQIFRDAGITVYSNTPLEPKHKLENSDCSFQHTIVDMDADEYTVGKPHPMIAATLRKQRILDEARDPQLAILFLDFILGYNASMDPVGELLDAILEAKRAAARRGGNLTVVASVCGTDGDPQNLKLQTKLLEEAGGIIFTSNAKAASFCVEMLR
ncbi:MAG TPA: acyl-CoA synthetase FdrA [Oculatellaceae cyanobacterium]